MPGSLRSGSLSARHISKSYAAVQVLERVSLVVAPGDRLGIVGPNGIGKSTLLRVLAGIEEPDAGQIVRSGAVGYLPQEPEPRAGETVRDYLARRTGVGAAEREMDALAARLGDEPELAGDYNHALDRFLALGGDDFDARARATLDDVGLGRRADREVASLSGGEASRAALAAILLARFDVFLLDEPTNNLDFAGLERLERFLDGLAAGVVLVSHDRAFLDRTVNRIVEIEAETRKVHEYAGTWSEYETARERARAQHEAAYADYVGERERLSSLLADRRSQAHQLGGARKLARQTGGADRRATNALRAKVQQAKNHLERLDEVEKPWSPWKLELQFAAPPPTGAIVELNGAVARVGAFELGPVDLLLGFGARLAIVGRNGAGKTTLIRALTGDLPLAAGDRRAGAGAVFGELNQARDLFTGRLLDDFAELSRLDRTEARTLLAKFALGPDDVERPAPSLSPGERTRAALALLAARGVNCLVLDEPTNHLDLEAIEELETALADYEGCLVAVTHDRRFLERLEVTRTLDLG
jgi:ATPase subunit of ABC transporter with duplicated ATPase domains